MPTGEDREIALKPLPRAVENVADDPSLHNPLARQERLSTGWFGVSTLLFPWSLQDLFLLRTFRCLVASCLFVFATNKKSQYWTWSCVSICAICNYDDASHVA